MARKTKTFDARDRRHFFTVALFPDGPSAMEEMGHPASEEVTDKEQQDAFDFIQAFLANADLRAAVIATADWMSEYYVADGLPPDLIEHGRDTLIRFAQALVATLVRKGVQL
jgi:hypothetical protein